MHTYIYTYMFTQPPELVDRDEEQCEAITEETAIHEEIDTC